MLVDTSWMAENYAKYNNEYWDGQLPQVSFEIGNRKGSWGQAMADIRNGRVIPTKIILSNYLDQPEEVKLNTLLHEMIHIADYAFYPEHYDECCGNTHSL